MSDKNEVFEYLIDQLRQQVTSNPYKQQCEDLAHEVRSLKNQLRDASAQIKELQSELQHQIDLAAGVYRWSTAHFDEKGKVFKVERGVKAEQSGCRKEDVRLPVCRCVPAHCGTYHGNTIVCDNCGGVIPE
jgi:hypothetical protein